MFFGLFFGVAVCLGMVLFGGECLGLGCLVFGIVVCSCVCWVLCLGLLVWFGLWFWVLRSSCYGCVIAHSATYSSAMRPVVMRISATGS
jgi:hypothetical protein